MVLSRKSNLCYAIAITPSGPIYKRKLGQQKLMYPIQKLGQQNFLDLVLIQILNQYINSC